MDKWKQDFNWIVCYANLFRAYALTLDIFLNYPILGTMFRSCICFNNKKVLYRPFHLYVYKFYLISLAYFWNNFFTVRSISSFVPLLSMFFVWSFVNGYCEKLNALLFAGASSIVDFAWFSSGFCAIFHYFFLGRNLSVRNYVLSFRIWVRSNFNLVFNTIAEATIAECVCNFIVHWKYWIASEVEQNEKKQKNHSSFCHIITHIQK